MPPPLFLLFCLIVLFIALGSAPAEGYLSCICDGGDYTTNSAFQSSLNGLLDSLSSSNETFVTDARGSIPDSAYGLALCRGDVNLTACADCVQAAARDVRSVCTRSKQATVWDDYCMLRYADVRFFQTLACNESHAYVLQSPAPVGDPKGFVKMEMLLLEMVIYQAAYKSSLKFATGMAVNGSAPVPKIYAMAQCTRDLSVDDCSQCLQQSRAYYGMDRPRKEGGRIYVQSCNFRYETYSFFEGGPVVFLDVSATTPRPYESLLPPHPPSSLSDGKGTDNIRMILLIVIPISVGLGLATIFFICFQRRSTKKIKDTAAMEEISNGERLLFDLPTLKAATNNFADCQKLGQGGFGTVYKGTLPNGENVAVKRLSASSKQGIEELKNELILVAKLQHKNLVRLRGVCLEEDEKVLVYEYVPNGSLDSFLFDPVKCKQLNWERRFNIIQGMAQGLLYLHEESPLKVVHRDLKASNILLDVYMQPKIAEFGLARLFGENETQHITQRVVGTLGYMAPEYARLGYFSLKLDVYSFGILILEIVTGKRCSSFRYDSENGRDILSYTFEHWKIGTTLEIMDPSLGGKFSSNEVLRCIQIGLLCTQDHPRDRPPMSAVFLMLHDPSMTLQEPLQPTSVAAVNIGRLNSTGSTEQSTLGTGEEFSTTLNHVDEDRHIIKRSVSEGKKAVGDIVFSWDTT